MNNDPADITLNILRLIKSAEDLFYLNEIQVEINFLCLLTLLSMYHEQLVLEDN